MNGEPKPLDLDKPAKKKSKKKDKDKDRTGLENALINQMRQKLKK